MEQKQFHEVHRSNNEKNQNFNSDVLTPMSAFFLFEQDDCFLIYIDDSAQGFSIGQFCLPATEGNVGRHFWLSH